MRMTGTQFTQRLWRQVLLASSTVLYLILILTVTAFASSVTVSDQAGVLNEARVRDAASALSYPVSIYTMNGFSGSTEQFDQRARDVAANHSNMVVIAIDTSRRHVFVTSGRDVPLTQADKANAVQAFISGYRGGHQTSGGSYTDATVNSLNSLKSSLGSRGGVNDNRGGIGIGTCLLGLLILGGLIFFIMRKSRKSAMGGRPGGLASLFNRPRPMNPDGPPPYQGNYPPYQENVPPYQGNVPPYQGNYPPYQGNVPPYQGNYPPYQGGTPPYYGPGYPPQQRGMNPLAAGGLGAAAGGLLGYELGRSQGERGGRGESGGDFGGGGDAGGGAGGYFGGGDAGNESGGGDFGGGDAGAGSGGDFGGGDFGGGGDGGGGSGGNF